jgi:hypothetical protein
VRDQTRQLASNFSWAGQQCVRFFCGSLFFSVLLVEILFVLVILFILVILLFVLIVIAACRRPAKETGRRIRIGGFRQVDRGRVEAEAGNRVLMRKDRGG